MRAATHNPLPRWRGFNLLGLFYKSGRSGAGFTESDFQWISEWGFNFVRVPMAYPSYLSFDRSRNIKPEEVYQLARMTRRDVMMVDLSQVRSKWFGESEKKVKQIFDDYAAARKACDTEPILFINEADGLLSRRIDLGASNESTDRVTNTMQNVLLQALESFEGILIATTNLTGNLDRAYERRFTFRLNFPRPDKHTRAAIWKEKLPQLSDDEAAQLGERFEISGGEIDNQVRQVLLRKVLRREGDLFYSLNESCRNTHGFSSSRKVGF